MKNLTHCVLFLFLIILSMANYASDNALSVSRQAQATLYQLKQWDNQVLKAYLQYRLSENQHLITFINETPLETVKTEFDASYNKYVKSLLKDQAILARLSKDLLSYSQTEKLDFDAMLGNWPLFHISLKNNLNKELTFEQSNRLLNRVLYFSLQDKYAQR